MITPVPIAKNNQTPHMFPMCGSGYKISITMWRCIMKVHIQRKKQTGESKFQLKHSLRMSERDEQVLSAQSHLI